MNLYKSARWNSCRNLTAEEKQKVKIGTPFYANLKHAYIYIIGLKCKKRKFFVDFFVTFF